MTSRSIYRALSDADLACARADASDAMRNLLEAKMTKDADGVERWGKRWSDLTNDCVRLERAVEAEGESVR
jgi:hypothetical protein